MKRLIYPMLLLALAPNLARSQDLSPRPKDPTWLLPIPELKADPKIPTLEQVVGHRWAQDVSSHGEIERYLHALVKAAPDRCRLVKYGQTYQGRNLYQLIVTSADNLKKIDALREQNLSLADPRKTSRERAHEIAASAPAIVGLSYCVHGNETSPSDAALITAYHLLADTRNETRDLLEKLVVLIDPLQNPDGRDRFVQFHRETRGVFDQDDPLASDRQERWPGGRFNHYLFDMNRDWFLHTQRETAARVATFLQWKPQIFVDAHEMGPDTTYFFDPSTDPYSPHTLSRQKDWHMRIGKNHAEHFDRHGFAYTTREMFDAFGPQYGSTWPTLHGSIGILWEQAGVRGRVIARKDRTKLFYHDGVRHHYISGLATLEAAARDRKGLLLDFYQNAADSVKLGENGPIRSFFLLDGKRPARAAALAQLLKNNGIEVNRLTATATVQATPLLGDKSSEHRLPVGTYHIPLNQPASRLALTLLERHQDMGTEYLKRQEHRVARGLPDEIYDATSWSLPLTFDVPCLVATSPVQVANEPIGNSATQGQLVGNRPRIGYLLSGEDDNALSALCHWLTKGLRVHVFSEPTRVQGVSFPRGSMLLRVAENPENLHESVENSMKHFGLKAHSVDNAFVDEGASLGGPAVHWVKPPRILLMVDRPASYAVGHAWHLFDQTWRYPVTRIAGSKLLSVDWSKFDACVLPDGRYDGPEAPSEDFVKRIKAWVQAGGTLVLVAGAADWASSDKAKLLASKPEPRKVVEEKSDFTLDKKTDKEKAARILPLKVPGAFFKSDVADDHFITWGVDKDTPLFFSGNLLFPPLKESLGKSPVAFSIYTPTVLSGFCWEQTLKMLPGKAFVLHQPLGKGHLIAFADDPTYRACSPPLHRLFFNAVFFGPSMEHLPRP